MNLVAKVMSMLLRAPVDSEPKIAEEFWWVFDIKDAINTVLWPILIVVAAAGTIYAIVLGVNMARADSTEKREESKKRVINVLVGMAIIIGLILLLQLFINQILPGFFPAADPTVNPNA